MTVIAGTCSRTEPPCSKEGVARCVTCKTWYCSAQCQADHWPRHWRECLPLPDLEWLVNDDKTQQQIFLKRSELFKLIPPGDYSVSDQFQTHVESGADHIHIGNSTNVNNIATTESPDTKEPTETVQTKTPSKTIDVGSADSSLQGEASSTPIKTAPETSAPKVSKPSVPVTVGPIASKPEDKEKTSEAPKTIPNEVVQVSDPPSQANSVKDSASAPPAVIKTPSQTSQTQTSSSSMYTEAQFSGNLPCQTLTKKVNEIVLPIDVIESPSNFVVRLADKVSLMHSHNFYLKFKILKEEMCIKLLSDLNENPPAPAPDNWKIGRKAIVAAYFEDIW